MVNCNPETVSTDYDTSDRLYFEPLTLEDVLEVVHAEQQAGPVAGVIVQLGGQTPLGLAQGLKDAGVPIVGTSPEAIHLAEERGAFGRGARRGRAARAQARHGHAPSTRPRRSPTTIGYPVLVRPSLRARRPRHGDRLRRRHARGLHRRARRRSAPEHPVLVDRFLDDAIEIDVDALYDGDGALPRRRHGAHRGGRHPLRRLGLRAAADHARARRTSTASGGRPRRSPGASACAACSTSSSRMAGDVLYVLEANPRASRTVPFVSKATAVPLAKAAARVMLGATIAELRAEGLLPAKGDGGTMPHGCRDRGQGGGAAVRPLPRRRHRARPGDALDRRGHGHRRRLRHRVRQVAGGGLRRRLPTSGHGVRLGGQPRQARR